MKKILSKTGIVALMALFLLAGYIEGIKIEPIEAFAAEKTKIPPTSPNIKTGQAAIDSKGSANKGLKAHSATHWQADDQKHKAQDHNEEEIEAFSIADLSSSGIFDSNASRLADAQSSVPELTKICCRG